MSEKKFKHHDPFFLPALYAIANIDSLDNPLSFIEDLMKAGARLLQLRSKTLGHQALQRVINKTLEMRNTFPQCKIIVNDSISLAKDCGADGVHLGQSDGEVQEARRVLGLQAIVGRSHNTLAQVQAAEQNLLSYIALGPIFASRTKSGHAEVLGLQQLKAACQASSIPLVAIGGITAHNATSVFTCGAKSVAVIADLEKAWAESRQDNGLAHLKKYFAYYQTLQEQSC